MFKRNMHSNMEVTTISSRNVIFEKSLVLHLDSLVFKPLLMICNSRGYYLGYQVFNQGNLSATIEVKLEFLFSLHPANNNMHKINYLNKKKILIH